MKQFRVASALTATAIATALVCGLGVLPPAQAQPDVNNAPRAENAVPNAPRLMAERLQQRQAQQRQMRNLMLRQGLAALGFADPEMHTSILAHLTAQDALEQTLLEYQVDVAQSLANPDDAEIALLLSEYNEAIEKYTEMRRTAEKELEEQINYSQHPKLELILRLAGAIGDHSNVNQLMMMMGGGGAVQ